MADYTATPMTSPRLKAMARFFCARCSGTGSSRCGLVSSAASMRPRITPYPCERAPEGSPGRFFDSYCKLAANSEYRDFVLASCAASMTVSSSTNIPSARSWEHRARRPRTRTCPTTALTARRPPASMSRSTAHRPMSPCVLSGVRIAGAGSFIRAFFWMAIRSTPTTTPWNPCPTSKAMPRTTTSSPGIWSTAIRSCLISAPCTARPRTRSRRAATPSTRWLGDDVTLCKRAGEVSPDFGDHGMRHGEPVREDWFPVLWRKG